MSRIPKDPSEIFTEFTDDVKSVFGDDLVAILLYGSGAKGEYRYKKSDINFMIVLTEGGIDKLSLGIPLIARWRKRNVSTPLFLTEAYIHSSLDSFPIEFLEMQQNYKLVFGKDVLKDIRIRKEDLRIQCERELKGKLLQLREGFLTTAHHADSMKSLIARSVITFAPIFSGLLELKTDVIPPNRREMFAKMAEIFGLDEELFRELLAIRETNPRYSREHLHSIMERYIREISQLTQTIDQL